ncbi:MAG: carboxymuconolactone decarboxylase family protein [Vicinamibacterales bacterium]
MSYIRTIPPDQAEGDLARLYDQIARARGGVAAIHQAQSLNPPVIAAHMELYKAIMFRPSPLSRAWREAIAVAVSRANHCAYCVAHHEAALQGLGGAPDMPDDLLQWAADMARAPERADAGQIDRLRALGLDERSILDAILVVAYFSFANRLVMATGVPLEHGYQSTCRPEFNA